ncbi:MAG: dihydrolipoamide acetyltransferase family protein [Actinomycetota bacterium]
MSKEIIMPQLGQTTDEVKLIKWLVEEGQDVKRGQALCEVETDKSNMELESFESGSVLKLIAQAGQVIPTGQVIALIGEKGEDISKDRHMVKNINAETNRQVENSELLSDKSKFTDAKLKSVQSGGPSNEPGSNRMDTAGSNTQDTNSLNSRQTFINEEFKASPIVKNIAKIKNIDLRQVRGTGPQGIITKDDLGKYLTGSQAEELPDEYVLSKNQVAVARNITASKSLIPHYYIKTIINADPFLKWRGNNLAAGNSNSADSPGSKGKISVYAMLVFAAANTLKKFPKLNGYFRENKILLRKNINIGFAVGQGEELFVPVIKRADTKSIFEIDKEVKSLIAKSVSQVFEEGDLTEGTFTISNLGMYDVDEFCAIINPPQAGILAAGKIKKVLYVDEFEKIGIRSEFTVTGSFDHRIVNGKTGAQFLQELKKTIEEKII